MNPATCLTFLAIAAVGSIAPIAAQNRGVRVPAPRQAAPSEPRSQTLTLHNPYTSGTFSAELLLPARPRPIAGVVLVTGSGAREQQALRTLSQYLAQRAYAVMILPPVPASGASENDNLDAVAALHALEMRPDLHGAHVGLVGYGEGVRLAAIAASEGSSAAFLVLLGGAVVADRLNTVPDTLARGTLPRDEAVRSLRRVRSPVLIVMGEYDRQGTHRTAAENSEALRSALDAGRHENYTIKVLGDADYLLADTGAGGTGQSSTAMPPVSVWRTTGDWMDAQIRALEPTAGSDAADNGQHKPTRLYPKSIYGPFNFHPWYIWQPAIGDQTRPYGFWYW